MIKTCNFIEFLNNYMIKNFGLCGFILLTMGLLLTIGSINDWNWIYGPQSSGKLRHIVNAFGRRAGRWIGGLIGLLCMSLGIIFTILSFYNTCES